MAATVVRLERCLEEVSHWMSANRLKLNANKTPSRTVGVSTSVNLPLHRKVQKFSSGTGSPGWSRKKGRKTVVVVPVVLSEIK